MSRWTIAALLLGLASGYVVGRIGTEPKPVRAARAADARETPDPAPAPSGDTARTRASASDPAPPGVAVVIADPSSATEDVDPEQGTLVVDFTDFDGPAYARLEMTDIEGNLDSMEDGADDDNLFSVDLYPGEVTVRWESGGAMRRYAARARIEAGRVTRILAADPRHTPLPDSPGLAILDVSVADTDGTWLAGVAVHLGGAAFGSVQWASILTDAAGRGRFRVRAGHYELQAGNRSDSLSLGAGEQRVLELRHEAHGEVVIEPRLEGLYSLVPRDRRESMNSWSEPDAVRFLFVPEGHYDLWHRFVGLVGPPAMGRQPQTAEPESRLLATLDVRPGRAERFAHHPEPGFLELHVLAPGSDMARRWEARVSGYAKESDMVACALEPGGGGLQARVGPLAVGLYKVEVIADGEVLGSGSAIVAYGPTQLIVDLRR